MNGRTLSPGVRQTVVAAAFFLCLPIAGFAQHLVQLDITVAANGAVVAGADVVLTAEAGLVVRLQSDAKGRTRGSVWPGAYRVEVGRDGARSPAATLVVPARSRVAVAILLRGGSAAPLVNTTTSTSSMNIATELVENLPVHSRDFLQTVATLVPLATGQPGVQLAGSFASDNRVMVDGVPLETASGSLAAPFVLGGIDRVQVITSGVSAEYGHFSGGVINVVTKSGTNTLSGSAFTYFENAGWRSATGFEADNDLDPTGSLHTYQAALGGPLLRDRLWYFGAVDADGRSSERNLFLTGAPFDREASDFIGGVRLTYQLPHTSRVTGQFNLGNGSDAQASNRFGVSPSTLADTSRSGYSWTGKWQGNLGSVLSANLWAAGVGSTVEREGSDGELIHSPQVDFLGGWLANYHYGNSRVPFTRTSLDFNATLGWAQPQFLSGLPGDHQLEFGVARSTLNLTGSGAPSDTGALFFTDFVLDNAGRPVLNNDGFATPIWRQFGTVMSRFDSDAESSFTWGSTSLFVNDRWRLNEHWSFNLGVRYDTNEYRSEPDEFGGAGSISPRLAASYHLPRDKGWTFNVSYEHFSGQATPSLQGAFRLDAAPQTWYVYTGPSGIGLNFSPAYLLNNYQFPVLVDDPSAIYSVDPEIRPYALDDVSFSVFHQWGKGSLTTGLKYRQATTFPDELTGDPVRVQEGNVATDYDGIVQANTTELTRNYSAFWTAFQHQLTEKTTLGLHYTYQFDFSGNYEGDKHPKGSIFGDYPLIYDLARHNPVGPLRGSQPNDFTLWATHNLYQVGRQRIDLSAIFDAQSGPFYPYTVTLPLTPQQEQRATDAGYVLTPDSTRVYFGDREGDFYDSRKALNLQVAWTLMNVYKASTLSARAGLYNVLGGDASWNFNPDVIPEGPVDDLGLPTQFRRGADHGQPEARRGAQSPRQFTISIQYKF